MIGSLCALLYFSKLNLASWCEMDLCVFFFFLLSEESKHLPSTCFLSLCTKIVVPVPVRLQCFVYSHKVFTASLKKIHRGS